MRRASLGITTLAMLVMLSAVARAQFSTAPTTTPGTTGPANGINNGGPLVIPGMGTSSVPQTQLTPDQLQSIMMMRALQNRGRGQVRTGVPQFVPMGPQGMMGGFDDGSGAYDQSGGSVRKSSTQRRAEARQARDEQKRATAGGDAKSKKAKAEQLKAERAEKLKASKAKAKGKKAPAKEKEAA